MTPYEKALQLVNKYRTNVVMWTGGTEVENQNVKECAKICVQEIIAGIESVIGDQKHFWKEGEKETHEYYTKVLKAIDTLP